MYEQADAIMAKGGASWKHVRKQCRGLAWELHNATARVLSRKQGLLALKAVCVLLAIEIFRQSNDGVCGCICMEVW